MIVVDLETSGADIEKCGIWQIGAIDTDNPENTFLEEARVEEEYGFHFTGDWVGKPLEETIGKSEAELRDKKKQSEKQLLENFFKWCEKISIKTLVCHNPQFDHAFLEQKAKKYGLNFIFGYKAFDTHTLGHYRYFQLNSNFVFKEGISDFGLKSILRFVGIEDKRGFHNALEDAKLTAEAFSRLVYGKNLLKEYTEFSIPDYLIKSISKFS
jgi:DNA polymerase III epsilon subunit-like protein